MYQVLLVDDEPIILSGIKFLIDWPKNNCQIIDTARNGKQALEKIRQIKPDIVICDISMPVLSGTDLLALVSEEMPGTVFIMLTNHPNFDLARDALRYRAVDYLLKSQLVPETLEASLAKACAECDARTKLSRAALHDQVLFQAQQEALQRAAAELVRPQKNSLPADMQALLSRHGLCNGCGILLIFFTASASSADYRCTEDLHRLYEYQCEVIEKLADTFFPSHLLLHTDALFQEAVLLCWHSDAAEWTARCTNFCERLQTASSSVTQLHPHVLCTDYADWPQTPALLQKQLHKLRAYYYQTGISFSHIAQAAVPPSQDLRLSGTAARLQSELRCKNYAAVRALFEKITARIQETPHTRKAAVWLCLELYEAAAEALPDEIGLLFEQHEPQQIEMLSTQEDVLAWINRFANHLCSFLEQSIGMKSDFVERARRYVQEHVQERIMLSDVAHNVCISPGYLSALHKKIYHQNFVDYINQVKTERACELIQSGNYRMYEISYLLGFENAYYFSKVFKRHTGCTPTEYKKSKENPHVESSTNL